MEKTTILLVEDNDDSRAIYATMLEHHGYEVVQASRGDEALEIIGEMRPDVILLDIAIPGVDGWTVAERLKADEETASICIIAVTAHALSEDRDRAHEIGCDAYLAKPVRPRRILEEIRRFTENGREAGDGAES